MNTETKIDPRLRVIAIGNDAVQIASRLITDYPGRAWRSAQGPTERCAAYIMYETTKTWDFPKTGAREQAIMLAAWAIKIAAEYEVEV